MTFHLQAGVGDEALRRTEDTTNHNPTIIPAPQREEAE